MKKLALLNFMIFGCVADSISQQNTSPWNEDNFMEGIYNVNANFYEVKAAGDAFFNQDSLYTVGNNFGYKHFKRYVDFFETRSYDNLSSKGDLRKYYELINNYSQNRSSICQDPNGYIWFFIHRCIFFQ